MRPLTLSSDSHPPSRSKTEKILSWLPGIGWMIVAWYLEPRRLKPTIDDVMRQLSARPHLPTRAEEQRDNLDWLSFVICTANQWPVVRLHDDDPLNILLWEHGDSNPSDEVLTQIVAKCGRSLRRESREMILDILDKGTVSNLVEIISLGRQNNKGQCAGQTGQE